MATRSTKAVVHAGRTTVVKDGVPVVRKGVVDIDAILAEKGLTPRMTDEIKTSPIELFGEEFRVLQTTNMFNVMGFGSDDPDDTARSVRSITNMVHPDDQKRFLNALARIADLSGEAMVEIISAVMQVATGENPTTSSSGSGRTVRRSASRALSAAN